MKRKPLLMLTAIASVNAGYAFSQDITLEEIVVTAQKKAQGLQDVPISLNVVSGDTLDRLSLNNMEEISRYVPNLDIKRTVSGSTIKMRGIGSGTNRGFELSVGMFIDGVYMGRASQFNSALVDLERVEALRGPQSVLFGKNTIAGAVNVTTARPSQEFEGSVTASYEGKYGGHSLSGYLTGSLTDNLSARLTLKTSDSDDGYLRNTGNAQSAAYASVPNYQAVNATDSVLHNSDVARVSLLWEPSDELSVYAKYERADSEQLGTLSQITEFGRFEPLFKRFDPLIDDRLDLQNSSVPEGIEALGMVLTSDNAVISVDYDAGNYTINSISSYSQYNSDIYQDSDFTPIPLGTATSNDEFEQFSQELRLNTSLSDSLDLVAGVYYQKSTFFASNHYRINMPILAPLPAFGSKRKFDQDADTWSLFAQATYAFNEDLRVVLGGRYSAEDKSAVKEHFATSFNSEAPNPALTGLLRVFGWGAYSYPDQNNPGNRSENQFTPLITVQYDMSDNTMLYFTATEGFKGGGFDYSDLSGEGWQFEEESASAIEFGGKTTLLDGAAELNFAMFYSQFEDLQVSTFNGNVFVTQNAAESYSRGLELDGRWKLSDEFMLTGALTYTDARYEDYKTAGCTAKQKSQHQGDGPCFQDLSDNKLHDAPEWSANIGLAYTTAIGDSLEFSSNLDLVFNDDSKTHPDQNSFSHQPSYTLIDFGIGLHGIEQQWSISLVGKNLSDERVLVRHSDIPGFSGAYMGAINQPRMFNLIATYRF